MSKSKKTNSMKQLFRRLHLYLSLPFGIILTLICFSGAMLALEKDIQPRLEQKKMFVHEVKPEKVDLNLLIGQTQSALPDSVCITGISIFADSTRCYQLSLSHPRKACLYVDPYTGQSVGRAERLPFFQTMFRLHRWLLGPAQSQDGGIGWGRMLVGTSTLLFVVILITGIVLWWPTTISTAKKRLRIPQRRGIFRFSFGLHLAGGAYTFILLLLMALTGLTWSFPWYKNGLYTLLGVEQQPKTTNTQQPVHRNADRKHSKTKDFDWQNAANQIKQTCPDAAQWTLSPYKANVKYKRWGNVRAIDEYQMDSSGAITHFTPYADSPISRKVNGWIFSLHTGAFAGHLSRWLWMLTALIGAALPLTGYYMWWRRISKRKKHHNDN